jgi:murein L,D-transpeptidase YcbB/YkuD
MHDTPERSLFQRSSRAYSSGCVRLQHPRDMAAAVLQTSVAKVNSYVEAGKNQSFKVNNQIPVYVSYFTAWPNDDGKVGFYTDIYGRDKALKEAIEKTRELRSQVSVISS